MIEIKNILMFIGFSLFVFILLSIINVISEESKDNIKDETWTLDDIVDRISTSPIIRFIASTFGGGILTLLFKLYYS